MDACFTTFTRTHCSNALGCFNLKSSWFRTRSDTCMRTCCFWNDVSSQQNDNAPGRLITNLDVHVHLRVALGVGCHFSHLSATKTPSHTCTCACTQRTLLHYELVDMGLRTCMHYVSAHTKQENSNVFRSFANKHSGINKPYVSSLLSGAWHNTIPLSHSGLHVARRASNKNEMTSYAPRPSVRQSWRHRPLYRR